MLSLSAFFFLCRGEKKKASDETRRGLCERRPIFSSLFFLFLSFYSMNRAAAGLASALAAAAATGRSRVLDARLLAPLRSLTADAALAEQQQHNQPLRADEEASANDVDDASSSSSSSARARRLREMEASTSSSAARSARFHDALPTAAEVSARLRGALGGRKGSFKSAAAAAKAAVVDDDDSNDVDSNKNKPQSPPRDWRDALEAARELEGGGDPLTDTFG